MTGGLAYARRTGPEFRSLTTGRILLYLCALSATVAYARKVSQSVEALSSTRKSCVTRGTVYYQLFME